MGLQPRARLENAEFYYGWVISAMCFSALLSIYAINFSFGVFFDFLVRDLGASRANTSLVFSVQTIAMYASAAAVGNAVGRYNSRSIILVGAVFLGTGMFGASRSTTLVELLVSYGVVAGIGMGMIYVIGFSTTTRWFHRRRGLATAIATSGIGVATFAAPPIASRLIDIVGWKATYLIFTVAVLGVLGVVAIFIADSPWTMDVDAASEFDPSQREPTIDTNVLERLRETATVAHSRSFLLVLLAWAGIYIPIFTIIVYLVTYTTDVGMARWVGVWALSITGAMTVPGRLIFGSLADRFGRTRFFVALTSVLGLAVLTLPFVRSPPVLFAFGAVYGLLYGGTSALVSPLIADFYGAENVAALYGVSALAFGVAALAGPFLAGTTYGLLGTYTPFLVGSAVISFVGTGCIVLVGLREGTI